MISNLFPPRTIRPKNGGRPYPTLAGFVWAMSGRHQIFVCGVALVVAALSMAPLELQRRIVNGAVERSDLTYLFWLGGLYLGVVLLQAVIKYGLRLYQGWLSESAIRHCRNALLSVHRRHAVSDDKTNGGSAVSVIGNEIDKLGGFVGDGFSQPCVNLGMLIVIGGYMLTVDATVAALCLPFLLPQIVVVPLLQIRLNRMIAQHVKLKRGMSDSVAETNGDDTTEDAVLHRAFDNLYRNRIRFFSLKFALKMIINLMSNLAPLSALVFGGYFVIQGETSIGVVVAFMSGFDRLASPLRELIAYYRIAAQASVQHRMIKRWI